MHYLPAELLELILLWLVRDCSWEKQQVLETRLVCKAFDAALQPYVLKTLKLGVWHLSKNRQGRDPRLLSRIGGTCEALYLDMTLVRDEEELLYLTETFRDMLTKDHTTGRLLDTLRSYSMSANTFDEDDYRQSLAGILENTPNLTRLKSSLPYTVTGGRSRAATLLLATTFDCLAKRSEECKPLEVLVLEHLCDATLVKICTNPIDLSNAMNSISYLKTFILTIKRREISEHQQFVYNHSLWFLIRKATMLENLCINGWLKKDITKRVCHGCSSLSHWRMNGLPYYSSPLDNLACLRTLNLHRINVTASAFLSLIEEHASTLKELYLNEVHLKLLAANPDDISDMWIGHADIPKPETSHWIAESLCAMPNLNLNVLRATCLGYDVWQLTSHAPLQKYDLQDPLKWYRSFDDRFVQAVMFPDEPRPQYPIYLNTSPLSIVTDEHHKNLPLIAPQQHAAPLFITSPSSSPSPSNRPRPSHPKGRKADYDAVEYQEQHETAARLRRCIDGYFVSRDAKILDEMHLILALSATGMAYLEAEIERAGRLRVEEGRLVDG